MPLRQAFFLASGTITRQLRFPQRGFAGKTRLCKQEQLYFQFDEVLPNQKTHISLKRFKDMFIPKKNC
jgi:hypothetical protein